MAENKGCPACAKAVEKNKELMDENEALREGEEEIKRNACCGGGVHDHKDRDDKLRKILINRLKRIEGQIRGIEGMVENSAYCPDILIQVSAVNSALNSFNKELLAQHIKGCVAQDVKDGNEASIDELVKVIQKIMK